MFPSLIIRTTDPEAVAALLRVLGLVVRPPHRRHPDRWTVSLLNSAILKTNAAGPPPKLYIERPNGSSTLFFQPASRSMPKGG